MSEPIPTPTPGQSATEPLLSPALITGLASAALSLAVAFGLHLSKDQTRAILGFVAIAAPIVLYVWGRRRVFSPATVHRMVRQARAGLPVNPADPPAGGTDKKSGV